LIIFEVAVHNKMQRDTFELEIKERVQHLLFRKNTTL